MTEPELRAWGESVGRSLSPGQVIWLEGDLGAGKTTLAQAILRGLGVADLVTSPTFGLVHSYRTRLGVAYHVDCYRLRTSLEARDLDWLTIAGPDVSALLIEWPDRAASFAPAPTLRIKLVHTASAEQRTMTAEGSVAVPAVPASH